ncbi:MAG TPA: di-trans,poly-cis-decaprenylcistransferase [Thermoplasmatales archaeon]|nr:di-trans,poly-cis-decaprenylcistransferase [Thermoplasmatales archaeon]
MVLNSPLYKSVKERVNSFRDKRLEELVRSRPLPQHVAVIMDGNRRYARRLGLSEEDGHRLGRNKLQEVLEWCFDLGIKVLTVYAFSTENFKRNEREVKSLLNLCKEELERASRDSRIHKNQVKVNIIGHLDLLPEDLRESARQIMDATKHYSKYVLNIALAYGGRQEIIDAIKKIAQDVRDKKLNVEDINEERFSSYLYTKDVPDPDLILRTSGEERISNFLLWQLAYSELYFSDVYWPALRKRDFLRAIYTYQQRKRKFGR